MKANLPPPIPDPDPQPTPMPSPAPAILTRVRRGRKVVAGLVAVAVLAGAWWWFAGREKRPDPPLPPDITDIEVKQTIEQSRAKVLAEPKSAEAWGKYGLVLLGNLFDREADASFARAAELAPDDPRWPYGRALIALKRNPQLAPDYLRQTTAAAGRKHEYRAAANLTLAEALLEKREIDAAAELFASERGDGAGEPRAVFGLALVALARNDDVSARALFEAIQNNPYCRKQVAAQLATLARVAGDAAAARRHEDDLKTLPDDAPWPDPILDRVLDLQVGRRGRDRRIDMLERAGRIDDARQECLAELALGRTAKALTRAAVNIARPGQFDPGRPDEAISLLREAVALDPKDPQARYTLALVLFTRAEREWHANPNSTEATARLREVIAEAERTIELKPDYAEAYLFWGLSLKFLGDPKAAAEQLRKGLVANPGEFMLNLSLGQVLAATEDRTAARTYLENARKLRPDDPRPKQELDKLKW